MIEFKLAHFSSASILMPLLTLTFCKFRIQKSISPLAYLVVIGAVVEFVTFKMNNNLHFMNAYLILSILIIGLLFYKLFESKLLKRITLFSSISLCLFSLYNFFYMQGIHTMNSYTLIIQVLLVVFFSCSLLYACFSKIGQTKSFLFNPEILIAVGFLVYYGGNFFTFAYSFKILSYDHDFTFKLWNLHSLLNILFNIIVARVLYISRITI